MKKLIWLPIAVLIPVMTYLFFRKQYSRDTDVKDLQERHTAYAQSIVLPLLNNSVDVLISMLARIAGILRKRNTKVFSFLIYWKSLIKILSLHLNQLSCFITIRQLSKGYSGK